MKAATALREKKKQEKNSVWSFFGSSSPDRNSMRQSVVAHSNEIEFIKGLINVYFNIVRRNLIDYIPKTVITMLVKESCDICDKELVTKLYKEDTVEDLLSKNGSLQNKRKEIESDLKMLGKCQGILDQFERASVRSSRFQGR